MATLWCNMGEGAPAEALIQLLHRLLDDAPEIRVVITAAQGIVLPKDLPPGITRATRPVDLRQMTERFLHEYRPDAVLLTGSDMIPSATQVCSETGIPVIVMCHVRNQTQGLKGRWLQLRARSHLRPLSHIFVSSAEDISYFRRMGVPDSRIEIIGPIFECGPSLSCNEAERDTLAELLGARPVWCADRIAHDELSAVEAAHRASSRRSHRLLLIVVPDRIEDGAELRDRFRAQGWQVALRSHGEEPEPTDQVYVADTDGELGLWYRLAPITFIGNSLTPPGGGHDPFDPAALGSAIVHGPRMHRHAGAVARLYERRAVLPVADAEELGEAITNLLSPDRAARLAQRAWDVSTEGADAVNRVLDVVRSHLPQAAR